MSADSETPRVYACPECGADDWIAHYDVPASQRVKLTLEEGDATPVAVDYLGGEEHYDADEDEAFECRHCGLVIDLEAPVCSPVRP